MTSRSTRPLRALSAALLLVPALLASTVLLAGCPPSGVKCTAPQIACGNTCVDPESDSNACGACGNVCAEGHFCQSSCCVPGELHPDVVLACYWTGELVPFQAGTGVKGTAVKVGTNPQSIAKVANALAVLDGHDAKLYEAALASLQPLPESNATGIFPNQVLAENPYVYVVNSGDNSIQVLGRANGATADVSGTGLGLSTVGSLSFGANTDPVKALKVGSDLYVSLFGGFSAPTASQGNKVVKVSVADPAHPAATATYDLNGLDLKPTAGTSYARPAGLALRGGGLYVALNNLDIFSSPNGPGLLARIDLASGAVKVIDLGGDACVQAGFITQVGELLAVGCSGQPTYDSNYALVANEHSGVVLVNGADQVISSWKVACPQGATDCKPVSVATVAAVGQRLLVADQNGGRLFILEVENNALVERRGFNVDPGSSPSTGGTCRPSDELGPIQGCGFDPRGFANISDILPLP